MAPWPRRWEPAQRAYQRRNPRPVVAICGVLLAAVVFTWSTVFSQAKDGPSGSVCPAPALAASELGAAQPVDALASIAPAPPANVRIRVLNGGGQRGQANLVASQLGELGFTEATDPTNDPLYPAGNLVCRGQIRYGANGQAAARTVRLVLPCLALVKDARPDDTVDVAVGTLFGEVNASKAAKTALQQLSGQTSMADSDGPSAPSVDPDLLKQASEVPC
jgi:LytR cell envelope-related transcriptional attenuator